MKLHLFLNQKWPKSFYPALMVFLGFFLLTFLIELQVIATEYNVTDYNQIYSPPSFKNIMGTDFLGRDFLMRALHGARIAVYVGLFSSLIATFIGLSLGTISGFFGGIWDDLIVWLYTTLDSIPSVLLILALSFSLEQGLHSLYLIIGLTSWVSLCRMTRAEVMKQRGLEYILSAQALGYSKIKQITSHILPNVIHIVLIQFALIFVYAIKAEVILSYLGIGIEPGEPSWGVMISDAKAEVTQGIWWGLFIVTFLMFVLVLSINLVVESIRFRLDPKNKSGF